MRLHPLGHCGLAMAQRGGEAECQAQADRHRLAMQHGAVAALRLDRVAEGVAQVQQRAAVARPLLPLVVADHGGLERAGAQHRLRLGVPVVADHDGTIRLAPGVQARHRRSARPSPPRRSRPASRAAAAWPSVAVSAITMRGWWKAPSRFLPRPVLIPVLPPTPESTCASSVVGNCTNGSPRNAVAAANPARSPTTPPPRASTAVRRSAPVSSMRSTRSPNTASDLDASPGRDRQQRGSNPVAARPSSRAAACSAATVVSLITTTRFCGSTGASRAPARGSSPSPTTTS